MFAARSARRRRIQIRPRLAGVMLLLAIGSAIEMAVLYHPTFDPSRVYDGTDTRAFGLLCWLLGQHPLRWLGVRSYGIYLWHAPIIVLTNPSTAFPTSDAVRCMLQVGLTIILAGLSWRFVEEPIRRGALGRLWTQARLVRWRPAAMPRGASVTLVAYEVAHALTSRGYRGCWVIALGTNDSADLAVGSNVRLRDRIRRMMSAVGSQPVVWLGAKSLVSSGPTPSRT